MFHDLEKNERKKFVILKTFIISVFIQFVQKNAQVVYSHMVEHVKNILAFDTKDIMIIYMVEHGSAQQTNLLICV